MYFLFIFRYQTTSQMKHATVGTTFLGSLWPAFSNRTHKDVQRWKETDQDRQTELQFQSNEDMILKI